MSLVVTSCSGGAVPTTSEGPPPTSASTTTTLPTTTDEATTETVTAPSDDRVLDVAFRLLDDPTEINVSVLAQEMAANGNERWVPYLVELIRLIGSEDAFAFTAGALEELTGVPVPEDGSLAWATYGRIMYERTIDPGPEYLEWKAGLYGLLDPAFVEMLAAVDDPVLASQLQWGGVTRGGIPELNDQPTIPAAEAGYMATDELTFGAVIGGEARAYPHRILDHHELANDTLGGEPVALANCTLCRTGVLFSRIIDGQVYDFQTSGLLRNSNKVMVDVQTDSLWNQLTGEAIAGPLTGRVLDRFPLLVTTWGDWVDAHPATDVVTIPDGPYSYQPGDAYAAYYASDDLWFPALSAPATFAPKDEVITIEFDGARLAVGLDALLEAGPQVLEVGGATVAVVPSAAGARAYLASDDAIDLTGARTDGDNLVLADGSRLARLTSGQSFWFAWYVNHPDTAWWPEG